MSRQVRVVVVGATGLVGEALLSALAERRVQIAEMHALASDRSVGREVDFGDDRLKVDDLAGFDFDRADLVLFAGTAAVAREYVPRALDAGCTVVDASPEFRQAPDVPLVVPAVNASALATLGSRRLVASPGGATVALVTALQPLHAAVGVDRVNVVSLESVSGAGRDAVEELAGQCAQLLNGRSIVASRAYPVQLAFNCIPQVGAAAAGGASEEERSLASETQKILGDPAIKVNATAIRVPVFFGDALAVHVELREPLKVREARRLLSASPGLTLEDDAPTPVTVGSEPRVALGRLREDLTHPRGLDFWIVADNVRRGSAVNTVEIVEVLVRDYF